jgi:ABC-type nickel/cobalt efflux system permease component RcnA
MEDKIEDTFDKLKAGAKAVAEKVTHPDKDLGAEYEKEKHKESDSEHDANCGCGHEHSDDHGSKQPMNPVQISKHEPTAVKRDKNQSSTGEPV